MRLIPPAGVMREAWKGRVDTWFPVNRQMPGLHQTALLDPTAPPGHWAFARMRFIATLELALSLPGRRVLDVAAGACFLAAGLVHAGREVTLNDLRPLDEPMRPWEFPPGTRVLQHNVFDLLPDEVGLFDIVVCTELIEHVAHPDELLRHLGRLLHPGGHLLLTTPNGSFLGNRLPTLSQIESFSALEKEQFKPDSDGHLFLLTPGELRSLLREAGFHPVSEHVFGSPTISGYLKFRHLSGLGLPRLFYMGEWLVDRLPFVLRERAASHLLVAARALERQAG